MLKVRFFKFFFAKRSEPALTKVGNLRHDHMLMTVNTLRFKRKQANSVNL